MRVGDRVIYVPNHAFGNRCHEDAEHGRITSFSKNGETVFVRFDKDVARLGWDSSTSKGCYPNTLVLEEV